jgi:hypothetical protein
MNLVTVNFEMPCMVCRTEFQILTAWRYKNGVFLGAFAILRNATLSFVVSVGNWAPTGRIIMKYQYVSMYQ